MFNTENIHQITDQILMVRPSHFGFNEETAGTNAFQIDDSAEDQEQIKQKAQFEFDEMVRKLRDQGVAVLVIEDTSEPAKTDAVFPNNWISFHENSTVVTYPMFSENRRHERREDIIDQIEVDFDIKKRYSFDYYEDKKLFLEGTGSMVLDRVNRVVYACLSPRTDVQLIEKFAVLFSYSKCVFHAQDKEGQSIYHTNVLMALGEAFVIICLDAISRDEERKMLIQKFKDTDKEIIEITMDQMYAFAGNMLQVRNKMGEPLLIMSEQAFKVMDPEQIRNLREHSDFIYCDIGTIEKYGGGSVRCMMAEIFLPKKIS